ncbi:GNAT family N-acetyltransferase [Bizionia arctica]|uniref:AttT protein n=1 Tax=Bizionia arctica TaxID=1495645 RepID=A0A917LMF8_9FLAO|nr:GNAT family N-acetyltransferase [Bizionia arctica]GGG44229.1 AttT protein [Bizionia arctica]
MRNYKVVENKIPLKTYQNLRIDCGLSSKTDKASEIGLKNSIHSMMIEFENKIIGMGRIVGDGGCFCQIVDICILPQHQGQGLGKVIMKNLSDFINMNLPESCYVSLIADGDASFLYEKFGFKDTMPESKGMYLKKQK